MLMAFGDWCDSCEHNKITQLCLNCETGFCEECFEEHIQIHDNINRLEYR